MELTSALSDRYRIERELGRGGMATVYLAEDLRHGRKVAVKVLHPELAAVLGAERFLAEIKVTAALQHPHILPLFDSGQAEGQLFYVMPYVEGESLRDRLERERQLPIDDAIRTAREVSSALDYAHRHGVIHRDIKPENILVHDGTALVADFGIALAVTKAGAGRLTQTGLSLGTPQYMSPEQATGERTIDARTDVYSLGAVTYEMLTGDPPHVGSTVQAIIARVLTEKPRSVRVVRPNVPDNVAIAVERALEKLPADRWGSAREFADVLEGKSASGRLYTTAATREATAPPQSALRARLRDPLLLGVAAAALLGAGFGIREWIAAKDRHAEGAIRFPISLPRGTSFLETSTQSFGISPDGQTIAFVARGSNGQPQIYTRTLSDPVAKPLQGSEGAYAVQFSPDSKWIAFGSASRLRKIAVDGGSIQTIGTIPGVFGGSSWSNGGKILLSMATGGAYQLGENGGAPHRLCTTKNRPILIESHPVGLADGDSFLFTAWMTQAVSSATLAIGSASTGKCATLDFPSVDVIGYRDGFAFVVTGEGTLMAVPLDLRRKRITGNPIPLLSDIDVNQTTGLANVAMSDDGSIVYSSGLKPISVVLVDEKGNAQQVVPDMLPYSYPRFSPDGKKIALTVASPGQRDVLVYDIPSKTSTKITAAQEATVNERPEWTPDGRRVVFRSSRGQRAGIWWRPVDLSEPESPLLTKATEDYYEGVVTPDGRGIVYQLDTAGADVLYKTIGDNSPPRPLAATPAIESQARPSSDGRWLAFVSSESGRDQVLVQSFAGSGSRTQVSLNGGREPVWSRDGHYIYYRDDDDHVVRATITTDPSFVVTARDVMFDDTFVRAPFHANFDVSPDGSHFLFLKSTEAPELMVVHNWIKEAEAKLKQR